MMIGISGSVGVIGIAVSGGIVVPGGIPMYTEMTGNDRLSFLLGALV